MNRHARLTYDPGAVVYRWRVVRQLSGKWAAYRRWNPADAYRDDFDSHRAALSYALRAVGLDRPKETPR